MRIVRFDSLYDLAVYARAWEELSAGIPFRSWTWCSTWWQHYRPSGPLDGRRELYVLGALDSADTLVGLAPWYRQTSAAQGRAVRFLGSGEVCSDYLGLMCRPGLEEPVVEALGQWLAAAAASPEDRWDLLDLEGVDAADGPTLRLFEHLAELGHGTHRREGPRCWRIALPDSWDAYLAGLSKSHRKQVRRAQRELFDTGRAVLHTVRQADELPAAMDLLVDLHQRRRRALGQRGCFASPRTAGFHRQVAGRLLAARQLQLHWLELDGRPITAEYHLAGGGLVFAYQAGIDPDAIEHEPGSLITQATIRRAIERGVQGFDFLRGDEPYKAHWRAEPRPTVRLRVASNRAASRLRHGLWLAGWAVKRWAPALVSGRRSPVTSDRAKRTVWMRFPKINRGHTCRSSS